MELLKHITDEDISASGKVAVAPPRRAVRAVLVDEAGHMALLYIKKYDVYTIPGGGVEADESLEAALKRELLEETGCACEIIRGLGYISENRGLHNFTQISYYYHAKVVGEKGAPNMTQEEREEQTEVQWCTLQDALNSVLCEKAITYQQKYIQYCDRLVLEAAMRAGV